MEPTLAKYQALIDGLAGWPSVSVHARKIRGQGASDPLDSKRAEPDWYGFWKLLDSLDDESRELLASALQASVQTGVHNALAYLNGEIASGLRFTIEGEEIPVEPYGFGLHEDWTNRALGHPWPAEK